MTETKHAPTDTDLVLERSLEVPASLLWRAWTEPEHLVRWFTPRPWKTVSATIDLRAGGGFEFVMESPEGERFPHRACYLEVIEGRHIVWTDALHAGFRPAASGGLPFRFTAAIDIEPTGARSVSYRATAMHATTADRDEHAKLGFHEGWGAALDQLLEHVRTLG
jgi:uncharacterized protein YndB with AHSA1/START domain